MVMPFRVLACLAILLPILQLCIADEINVRGPRPTDQRSAGLGSCSHATADLCVHGDWGRKCPSGCRLQGMLTKTEKDIGKRVGDLTERLARLGRLYSQVHTDFRAVSDTSGQTLNEHNDIERRYSEVLRELERRIIHLQRRINMQLQQLTLLQTNIKAQVSQILRVELDIDIALRTCKGACAQYARYSLDKEKNLQLEKAATYLAGFKFDRFEEVTMEETLTRRFESSSHSSQPTHGQATPQPSRNTHSSATSSFSSTTTGGSNFGPYRQPTYVEHGRLNNPNEAAHSASSSTHTSSSGSSSQPVSPGSAFPLPGGSNAGTGEWDFNFHDEHTTGNSPRDSAAASSSAHGPGTTSHHTATSTSFSSGTAGKDVAPLSTGGTYNSGSSMGGGSFSTGTGGTGGAKNPAYASSAQGGGWSTGGSTATHTGSPQGGGWSTGGSTTTHTGSPQGGGWSTGGSTTTHTGSPQDGGMGTGGSTATHTGIPQGGGWSTGGSTTTHTGSPQDGGMGTGGSTTTHTGSPQGGGWSTGGSTTTHTGSPQGGGWSTGGSTTTHTGSPQGGGWSTGGSTTTHTGSPQGGGWGTGGSTTTHTGSPQGGGMGTGGSTTTHTGSPQGGGWSTGGSTTTHTGSPQGAGMGTGGSTTTYTSSAQGGGSYAAGGTGAHTASGSTSGATHDAGSLDGLPPLPDFSSWDVPDRSDIFARRHESTTTSTTGGGGAHGGAGGFGGGGAGASSFGSLFNTNFGPEFHEEFRRMSPGVSRTSSSSISRSSSTSGGKTVTELVTTKVLSNGTKITHHTKHVSTADGAGVANDDASLLLTGRKTRAARRRRSKATRRP